MTACTRADELNDCIVVLVGTLEANTQQVRDAGLQPPGILGRILRGTGSWDALLLRYTSCVSSSVSLVSDLGIGLLHFLLQNMREDLTPDKGFFSALIQSQTLFTQLIASLAPDGEIRSPLHGRYPPGGWQKYLIQVTALLETCSDIILNKVEDKLAKAQYTVGFVRTCMNTNLLEVLETLLRRERGDVAFICRSPHST